MTEFKIGDRVQTLDNDNGVIVAPDGADGWALFKPNGTSAPFAIHCDMLTLIPDTVTVTVELTREELSAHGSVRFAGSTPYWTGAAKLQNACREALEKPPCKHQGAYYFYDADGPRYCDECHAEIDQPEKLKVYHCDNCGLEVEPDATHDNAEWRHEGYGWYRCRLATPDYQGGVKDLATVNGSTIVAESLAKEGK